MIHTRKWLMGKSFFKVLGDSNHRNYNLPAYMNYKDNIKCDFIEGYRIW